MDFLNPESVLNQLELRPDMTAADFGSGSGGWALPLARKLNQGRVYAIDIQAEAILALKTRAEAEKLFNIKTIQADLEQNLGSSLQAGLLDLVLMTNLLFQVKNRAQLLAEAQRVLRTGGQLLIVDWKKDSPFGPSQGRLAPAQVEQMAEAIGLQKKKEFLAGGYHYGLVFTKS